MEEKHDARSSPSPPRVTVAAPPAVAVFPPDDHQAGAGAAATAATVTVATSPQHTLPLAIPIHTTKAPAAASSAASGSGGGGGVGGREDCWSEGATSVLIDAWAERFLELSRGNLKQKHWQEVAEVVSSREDYAKPPKTDAQCKNRIDTLKKKYKNEKSRISALPSSSSSSPWPFFSRLDDLISSSPHIKPTAAPSPPPAPTPAPAPPAGEATLQLPFQHLQPKKKRSKKKSQRQLLQTLRPIPVPAASPGSSKSFPPATSNGKRRRSMPAAVNDKPHLSKLAPCATLGGKGGGGGGGVRDLTRAILRFGEMYERVEGAKLQQAAEMEKQRMLFAKELELHRMQFFVKTQLELTQLQQRTLKRMRVGGGGGGNHGGSNGITTTTTSGISK